MFMIILCNTLLPSDKAQAILADFGKIFKRKPVTDRALLVENAPIIIIVSFVSNFVFRVL